ncbi:putative metal-dependent hydrolase [Marivirga sp. S37H4]|uniref:Metal-dependent hydrolase n=1 Tax=Marivirga aurantiaca TaxID=2802615 RepID=A0A934WZZ8_9BACT|nr:putative metal-dependent hydrolase [Marivirga aurantiaca]MBK6266149.1 putative metal-dependent hydrolase [Marivirga aurantiaca]
MNLNQLKFPIGTFQSADTITPDLLKQYINDISSFPQRLKKEVQSLSDDQLDTEYRPGGWTIRQVVNHCADSHMNSLMRLKLALTEDRPVIKPYFEDRWAELADSKKMPIEPALSMLEGIHARWTVLLKELTPEDLKRVFIHPEHGKEFSLDENIGMYAWHCNHHLAHITGLKISKGWT